MKLNFAICYMALLILTGLTWAVTETQMTGASSSRLLVVAALVFKFLVIAFGFMELVRAHVFWRIMAIAYVGVTAGVIFTWISHT